MSDNRALYEDLIAELEEQVALLRGRVDNLEAIEQLEQQIETLRNKSENTL